MVGCVFTDTCPFIKHCPYTKKDCEQCGVYSDYLKAVNKVVSR